MKNFIIAIALLAFGTQTVYAQTQKGSKSLGLSAAFYHATGYNYTLNQYNNSFIVQDTKSTSFNAGPGLSYFIADGVDIGANLGYGYTSNQNTFSNYPSLQVNHEVSGMVYARKYYMYQNKIGIRTGPYAGYSIGKQDNNYTTYFDRYSTQTTNFNAGGTLDILYYPLKSLGLAANIANLGYSHYTSDSSQYGKQNSDNFAATFISNALAISAFYVFGGK